MNLVFRIVFGIVISVIFFTISYTTFFTTKEYVSITRLQIDESQNLSGSGELFYNNISKFESIYTTDERDLDIPSGKNFLELQASNKYVTSIKNLGEHYELSGTGYLLVQKGIGEIYIDEQYTSEKVFIFSKNTPSEIVLRNDESGEEYTTIYLAPGMYLEFTPNRGRYLKNADRLRISTVYKLGYISQLDDNNIDELIEKYISTDNIFLHNALVHIDKNDKKKEKYLNNLISSSVPQISGYNAIQRYIHLFVNKEKKIVFYQNLLLESYISLVNQKSSNKALISQILSDEKKLLSIDKSAYEDIMMLRGDIVSSLYAKKDYKYIPGKISFGQLIDAGIDENSWLYPLYSYSLLGSGVQESRDMETLTKGFFASFVSYTKNSEKAQTAYDYFLYFLERRLLSLLSGSTDDKSIGATLEVISNYTDLSIGTNYSEKNQKITQLYSISLIMSAVNEYMRSTFFLDDRDKDNLLVLDEEYSLSGDRLTLLKKYLESLHKIFTNNSSLLIESSQRDREISKSMQISKKSIDEYIIALESYEKYKNIYDASQNSILTVDVISNSDILISEQLGREYLSKFVGFSQTPYTLEVVDNLYYNIENLVVAGRVFNFELYPFSSMRLKNISIDGEIQTTQYTLDNIEEQWGEDYETAVEEEKSQYDFSRFFILTFLTDGLNQSVDIFEKEVRVQESKAEIVFKRDILLGEKGEFSQVQEFLNIAYDDISLKKVGQGYDIFISDIRISIADLDLESRREISGILTSQYVLNSVDHSFKSLELKINKEARGSVVSPGFDFNGIPIRFIGSIYLLDIEDVLRDALSQYDNYISIYRQITSLAQGDNISIEYIPVNQKTRFKFDSGGKNYTIILQNGEVTGVYSGTQRLSSGSIEIPQISSYIQ